MSDTNVMSKQAISAKESGGLFERVKRGLRKTGEVLNTDVSDLVLRKRIIDEDLLEELEERLLMADMGVEVTTEIISQLTQQVERKSLADIDALYDSLSSLLHKRLLFIEQPLVLDCKKKPFVLLVVGVNGVGKTTTIGKLAKNFQAKDKKVLLAAGDTFRAAAVEQLQSWGAHNNVPVVSQHTGADSASVIFDAIQSGQAKQVDVVIADTAGRLHNKDNLMEELKKIVRVMKKLDDEAPHEILLVLDAGTGQNALSQAEQFNQAVSVSGLALTKLDGTAKGGVIFALGEKLGIPVRYIGVGESAEDLQEFNAKDYVQALFPDRQLAENAVSNEK